MAINKLKMETLHQIIDSTGISNPDADFVVRLADESSNPPKIIDVSNIYVKESEGVVYLAFTPTHSPASTKEFTNA